MKNNTKQDIIKIGLTNNPQLDSVKKNYKQLSYIQNNGHITEFALKNSPVHYYKTFYTNKEDFNFQFRTEEWEAVEKNAWRITNICSIENNSKEGESISVIWK